MRLPAVYRRRRCRCPGACTKPFTTSQRLQRLQDQETSVQIRVDAGQTPPQLQTDAESAAHAGDLRVRLRAPGVAAHAIPIWDELRTWDPQGRGDTPSEPPPPPLTRTALRPPHPHPHPHTHTHPTPPLPHPPLFRRAVGSVLFPLCHRVEPAPSWALCVFLSKSSLTHKKALLNLLSRQMSIHNLGCQVVSIPQPRLSGGPASNGQYLGAVGACSAAKAKRALR